MHLKLQGPLMADSPDSSAISLFEQGIYLAPSQFETLFMSGAHSDADIDRTIAAAEIAFQAVADSRK